MFRFGVTCIVVFVSLPVIGAGSPLTLADCWERIQAGNPSLREVGYRIESARLGAERTGAWTNPRLGATLRSDEREFELMQEFDIRGKRRLAQRAAAFETDLRRLDEVKSPLGLEAAEIIDSPEAVNARKALAQTR